MKSLRQAVYCDPSFALGHYTLSQLYHEQGNYSVAVKHLRLAQAALIDQDSDYILPHSDDLTVGMLQGLIRHQAQVRG